MDESSEEQRPKRSKRDTSYKSKAFEKFKDLKSGKRSRYEVEELENVYEVVEEREYVKKVLSRQDDDWIVDDDGSGYVEDGRDIFDDDLDSESIAQASTKGKGTKRKKKNVSENAGKGNIQLMLSSMPNKKKEETKIDDDFMLSEILGEIDGSVLEAKPKKTISKEYSMLSRKLAAKDYMKNFSQPIKKRPVVNKPKENAEKPPPAVPINPFLRNTEVSKKKNILDFQIPMCSKSSGEISQEQTAQESQTITEVIESTRPATESQMIEDMTQECFDDDFDMSIMEDVDSQQADASINEDKLMDELQSEFTSTWENFTNEKAYLDVDKLLNETDLPLVDVGEEKVFRFFWWDAFEEPEKHKGVVFLFGKTYCEKTKTYISCCVPVRNIYRRMFLLPRPYVLGDDKQPTEEPVTLVMVHKEVNETLMKPLFIKQFRARSVSKKYCFSSEIPAESDYLELQYSATYPKIDMDSLWKKPKTFSKIFGANSTFLETLLLERKIKGPCWLDVTNPVPVSNPVSWCKFEVNCLNVSDLAITVSNGVLPPPPLVVAAVNIRTVVNPKTLANEIVMISCLAHDQYAIDKQAPSPPFQQHFCVLCIPSHQPLPFNLHESLNKFKATKVQKMGSERALINYFMTQFSKIDPDLVVGHDLQGYQMNILADRLVKQGNRNFNKLCRLKRSDMKRLERNLFVGRLVCDVKVSAKELIKSRSYDLDTLCQVVLKLKENQRLELEPEDISKMYQSADALLKLVSLTMQDTSYILRMMYDLNAIPLALQITNIAGNVMSRTLTGGRSERNEFLLLHAFSEKNYIVPEKEYRKKEAAGQSGAARKKPTYSGGLVLEPKIGFYDKLVLLMDFNSLYPSIIQEYNVCFTTLNVTNSEDNLVLPDRGLPPGILPTEIRKLVESRRQVKGLMANPDISKDLWMQYNVRQMALKLTANSMYGCLGFSNSRFYAKNLAALVTHKGREILTNTKELVEKMCYEVVYGDTDSIMINTNIEDYDQVLKIGVKIKQEVNKLYKQVELDVDGVFKYLLLLKKKKYAAVTLTKNKSGKLIANQEYKGLDIVRRDWSQLACEAGKYAINQIMSEQPTEDRINNINDYLSKVRADLEEGRVPVPLLVITKQLNKDPKMYMDKNQQPHVQVALRYNRTSGGHFRAGDTVPYVICENGTDASAAQRAYHTEELKNDDKLKIDVKYYLEQQIYPVVTRLCEPIEGTDSFQIAERLGVDTSNFKKPRQTVEFTGENAIRPEVKFRDVDKFKFVCYSCKHENAVGGALVGKVPFLEKCGNAECGVRPLDYLPFVQNQLTLSIQSYISKYYANRLTCEDPACPNETRRLPLRFFNTYPVCTMCQKGVMYRAYSEQQLYTQLTYFQFMFDLSKLGKKPLMEQEIESGYHALRETVEKYLNHSGYSVINLTELFSGFMIRNKQPDLSANHLDVVSDILNEEDDEDF